MNKFLMLTRVLLKNSSGLSSKSGKSSRQGVGLIVLAVCLLLFLIPMTGTLTVAYDALIKVNMAEEILSGLTAATCIAMVIFGIMYVMSTYYFADDIVPLITMPLKPEHILASKFVIVNIYQYIWELFILLPCLIAYGIHIHTFRFILYSVILFLTLPLIPTVVCSVISMVLMVFGRFFRNKDLTKLIVGFLGITVAIGVNVFVQITARTTKSSAAHLLAQNRGAISNTSLAFPTSRFVSDALMGNTAFGLPSLFLFLAVSAAAVALFLLLGHGLYLSGVVGLTQSASKGKAISNKEMRKYSARRGLVSALAMQDWKIVLRTPPYFLNCVLSGLVFPPLMVVIAGISISAKDAVHLPSNSVVIGAVAVSLCFFCIMNMLSPTAVSREGKDFIVSRYIPVAPRKLIAGKLLPGLMLSWFALLVTCILTMAFLKLSFFITVLAFIIAFLDVAAFNMLGLFLDICFPKLEWDDETAAVKQNFNGLIVFLILLPFAAVQIIAGVLFLWNLILGFFAMLLLSAVTCIGAYALLFVKGTQVYASR